MMAYRKNPAADVQQNIPEPSEPAQPAALSATTTERSRLQLAGWLVAGITLIAYLPTLISAEFVDLDDGQYVLNNERVRSPSLANAGLFLAEVRRPSTVAGYYQPLTMISLMLDSWIGGGVESPTVFHLTSVLLHALNAVLVMLIVRAACGGVIIPACAALVFALHPLQVESVVWISQRKTVLSGVGAFTCIWLYLLQAQSADRSMAAWLRVLSIIAFAVALLAKPTALLLPLFLVLLNVWPLRRRVRSSLPSLWPYAALMLIFGVVAAMSQAATAEMGIPSIAGVDVWERLDRIGRLFLLCAYNLVMYAWHAGWPVNLSFVYAMPMPVAWGNWALLGAGAAALVILGTWLATRRVSPPMFTSLGGFLVLLLVALGPVRLYQSCVGDRFMYLPLAALCLGLAAGLKGLTTVNGRSSSVQAGTAVLAVVVLALLARASLAQQATWRDTESLWTRALLHDPRSAVGNASMATVRLADAERLFADCSRERSQGHDSEAGRICEQATIAAESALRHADLSIAAEPGNGVYVGARGQALILLKRHREAVAALEQALALGLGPMELSAHVSLGQALIGLGEVDAAVERFELGLERSPTQATVGVLMHMGRLLSDGQRIDLALRYVQRAASLAPRDESVLAALGTVAAAAGDYSTAVTALVQARKIFIQANNDAPELTLSLAKVLLELGRFDEAEPLFCEQTTRNAFPMESMLGQSAVLAARGDLDGAFKFLRQISGQRPDLINHAAKKPWSATLQRDPRWQSLTAQTPASATIGGAAKSP